MADSSNCSMARMNFGWAAINSLRAASSFPALSLTGFGADSLEERVLRNGLRRWRYSWYSWLVQASLRTWFLKETAYSLAVGVHSRVRLFYSYWELLVEFVLVELVHQVCLFPSRVHGGGRLGVGRRDMGDSTLRGFGARVEGAGPFGSAWGWFSRFSWFPRRTFGRRTFGGVGIRRLACYGAKLGLMDSLGCW